MAKQWFLNRKKSFPISDENTLTKSLTFIEDTLREQALPSKLLMRSVLLSEELIPQLISHAPKDANLYIQIQRHLGDLSISLSAKGQSFDPFQTSYDEDDFSQQAIQSILLKSYGNKLKFSYRYGMNHIQILADQSNQKMLIHTLYAFVFGLLFGLFFRYVFPVSFSEFIEAYCLSPIKTMFMNALQIVIGPVVFFSIVSSFTQFKNLSELGRIGLKIMLIYLATTFIAILLSIGTFTLLQPGEFGFAIPLLGQGQSFAINTDIDTSLLHTLIHIVPSNFIQPFLEANTLQIMFLAALCGSAVGMIGEYTATIREFFEGCNSLFLTITSSLSHFIPVIVFCSVISLVIKMDGTSLAHVLGYSLTILFTLICMILIYTLMILVFARLNPITFFKKNREGMVTSMMLSSSSAAMPTNLRTCIDKLGISPKVANFSIPLGATVNMDGTCIFLTITSLFLAKACGITIPLSSVISMFITIVLLSLGCPGIPGAGVVCLSVVLNSLNIPLEAIGLILAVNPIFDMLLTMSNTTGDVTASLIVAKSEDLLDLEVYNQ